MIKVLRFSTVIIIISLMGLIGFTGCSQTYVPVYTEVQKMPLNLPPYDKIKFEDVKFKVINYNGEPYFSLDSSNYSRLSRNMTVIQNYIKYLKSAINQYKDYYEGGNEEVENGKNGETP